MSSKNQTKNTQSINNTQKNNQKEEVKMTANEVKNRAQQLSEKFEKDMTGMIMEYEKLKLKEELEQAKRKEAQLINALRDEAKKIKWNGTPEQNKDLQEFWKNTFQNFLHILHDHPMEHTLSDVLDSTDNATGEYAMRAYGLVWPALKD